MTYPRWYPTLTTLPDGRILAVSGYEFEGTSNTSNIPELYTPPGWDPDPVNNNIWTSLGSAELQQAPWPYVFMFVLPNGKLLDAGPGDSRILDPSNWTWGSTVIPTPSGPLDPPGEHGSAVMYLPGKIMRCAGGPNGDPVTTTWLLDADDLITGWTEAPYPMNNARRNLNLVILPDGTVLAVGGNQTDARDDPVYIPELWNPGDGSWTELALPQQGSDFIRGYHSTAMLLPDGRVLSAGGELSLTAQYFSPPYLDDDPPRAGLSSAPTAISYGEEYSVLATITVEAEEFDFEVVGVALIRLASTTHGFDMDQRYVPLDYWDITGFGFTRTRQIAFTAPANANIAPPGYYMLWLLTETEDFPGVKVPCQRAAYVRVEP